jgi:predicted amidohydrolase
VSALRIAALELPATAGDPVRALAVAAAQLARGAPADVVLLPEQSLVGYVAADGDFDLTRHAEDLDGPVARACAALAIAQRTHLIAPLVLRDRRAVFNAMACFDPRGGCAFVYRKRHPWLPETWATAGSAPLPLLALGDHVLTLAICYDLHFLEAESAAELAAADVLLFPSAWVEEPDHRLARCTALAARAGVHIVNENWAPGIVRVPGQGGSFAVSPGGVVTRVSRGRVDLVLP